MAYVLWFEKSSYCTISFTYFILNITGKFIYFFVLEKKCYKVYFQPLVFWSGPKLVFVCAYRIRINMSIMSQLLQIIFIKHIIALHNIQYSFKICLLCLSIVAFLVSGNNQFNLSCLTKTGFWWAGQNCCFINPSKVDRSRK